MKTKVITTSNDEQHNDWKKDEYGYIDGYINAGNGAPLVCVIISERIELIPTKCLKVISEKAYAKYMSTLTS